MFSVSFTVDGLTFTVEGETLDDFKQSYAMVRGLGGLNALVMELDEEFALKSLRDAGLKPQPVTDDAETQPQEVDELARLIEQAPDLRALEGLYRAHRSEWNASYNDMAKKRRTQLDKAAKKGNKK